MEPERVYAIIGAATFILVVGIAVGVRIGWWLGHQTAIQRVTGMIDQRRKAGDEAKEFSRSIEHGRL